MLAFYTRRIQADPEDAYAYSHRARYYDYLRDREKATADMRQWSALLGGGLPSESSAHMPRRISVAINGPFGYQLAFCVGGLDKGIQFSVASRREGEMRLFQIPVLAASCLLACSQLRRGGVQATFGGGPLPSR
jgi:hypothetical protein